MNTRKVTLQMEQGCSLSFYELEDLCDDPIRNQTGQEVQAVLTPMKSGFLLCVRDGIRTHQIVDSEGRPAWFKTIKIALDRLSDVPHLWPEILLDGSESFETRE